MDTICNAVRLKPGSLERVRAWAQTLNDTRRSETLATLRDEAMLIESVFLWHTDGADYLIYYLKAENLARAQEIFARSTHAIDAFHGQFKRDTFESTQPLALLLDLDTLSELPGTKTASG